ncbi:MAG TPA: hypothetical protein VGJ51_19370 [Candidatus Angelobacter sp.]
MTSVDLVPGRLGWYEKFHPFLMCLLDVLQPQVPTIQQLLLYLASTPLFHLLPHGLTQSG